MKYHTPIFAMLLWTIVSLATAGTAIAQDKAAAKDAPAKQDKIAEQLRNNNPYLDKLHEASVAFIKDVPDEGVKTLYLIREAYGMIRSVHQVEKDVGHAVDLCGQANGDMKADLDARFDDWKAKVTPAVATQQKKLDDVIKKQSYKSEKEVRDYLQNIDNAAKYADKMLDKHVITTPDACKALQGSMDKTGPSIVDLLGQTTMPSLNDDGTAVVDEKTDNSSGGAKQTESEEDAE